MKNFHYINRNQIIDCSSTGFCTTLSVNFKSSINVCCFGLLCIFFSCFCHRFDFAIVFHLLLPRLNVRIHRCDGKYFFRKMSRCSIGNETSFLIHNNLFLLRKHLVNLKSFVNDVIIYPPYEA